MFLHVAVVYSCFRFKLIKWWAQSYLVAIPEIVCGFRDNDGVVHRLESFGKGWYQLNLDQWLECLTCTMEMVCSSPSHLLFCYPLSGYLYTESQWHGACSYLSLSFKIVFMLTQFRHTNCLFSQQVC